MRNTVMTLTLVVGLSSLAGHAANAAEAGRIAATPREIQPVAVGDRIPNVEVRTLDGKAVGLVDALGGRKTVLVVYRGGWCPFCTRHLAALQAVVPELRELGYEVVALAPDSAESVGTAADKAELEHTLLLDPGMTAIRALGLAFKLDDATLEKYRTYGIKLLSLPGTSDKVLPVPALYLVSADGTIDFAHWETDYKKRLDPADVVSAARGQLRVHAMPYKDGDLTMRGYMAYDPSRKERRPGVLVIHEWWGLNDYAKRRARQLARMGYVVLAADMYGNGAVADGREEAAKLAGQVRADRVMMRRRASRALSTLKADPRVDPDRVAAIGYCFGGGCVLELARSGAELAGVVSFHGNLDTPNPEATTQPKAAILACHGAADPYVSPESINAFTAEMNRCGADWQLTMYGGAVHAFSNPDAGDDPSQGVAYDVAADTRSWADMLQFFGRVFEQPE